MGSYTTTSTGVEFKLYGYLHHLVEDCGGGYYVLPADQLLAAIAWLAEKLKVTEIHPQGCVLGLLHTEVLSTVRCALDGVCGVDEASEEYSQLVFSLPFFSGRGTVAVLQVREYLANVHVLLHLIDHYKAGGGELAFE